MTSNTCGLPQKLAGILLYDQSLLDELCYESLQENTSCMRSVNVDWLNTSLNYSLILANVGAVIIFYQTKSNRRNITAQTDTNEGGQQFQPHEPFRNALTPFYLFIILVTLFQVSLCLVVCCVGVSIIWCAILGWMIMLRSITLNYTKHYTNVSETTKSHQQSGNESSLEELCNNQLRREDTADQVAIFVIGADCVVVLYYALIAEPITTFAHVCAVVLGIVLWSVFKRYS
eukprot:CCRYP_011616-RA/>CCRYP_011616-RA protein AED:0.40 eAED:0.40 QI:328/1/1/1/0/0/2/314/230